MNLPKETLQKSVAHQREALIGLLQEPLRQLATACRAVWADREQLNTVLADEFLQMDNAFWVGGSNAPPLSRKESI